MCHPQILLASVASPEFPTSPAPGPPGPSIPAWLTSQLSPAAPCWCGAIHPSGYYPDPQADSLALPGPALYPWTCDHRAVSDLIPLPWQRQYLNKISRKETTVYRKCEEHSCNFSKVLARVFCLDGGPTLCSLTYTLTVSLMCKDCVHNQNQHNQLNQFRRAMRMVIRQCFNG